MIGGEDPVELGKNNCGHGVGGSMVHYAGYAPRFHPSDFEIAAATASARLADLLRGPKPHYERVEPELPVSGQYWPWGDPHGYPHAPHPISGGAERAREGARAARDRDARRPGRDRQRRVRQPAALHLPRLLPAGLQGQREGVAAVTHLPDAIEHGVEIRADCMAVAIELDDASGTRARRQPT